MDKPYDLLDNNCEHFASYCYFGVAKSDQSNHVVLSKIGPMAKIGVEIFNTILFDYYHFFSFILEKTIEKKKAAEGSFDQPTCKL